MDVTELLRLLQAEHDETAARADSLREQIDQLTSALAEVEARLAEIVTTGKAIDGLALHEPTQAPAEPATVYQRIVTAFNEHPGRIFRVRDLHELLGLPTDEPSINVTRSRLGRLVRQGLLDQPGRGRYQNRTNAALRGLESAQPTAATLA
ncbi:type IV toxin-antitoxin system AbiEi family antitoxin domain-containing protein [Streptomyces sp. NPDC051658]|uniref:type IV toxin-antitoxin system AbiEi family antitoxin domain-containing protein n=1 Tax=Streptomyces sp. NPDC051658 TaxID=3365667 RepID=UPI0037982E48